METQCNAFVQSDSWGNVRGDREGLIVLTSTSNHILIQGTTSVHPRTVQGHPFFFSNVAIAHFPLRNWSMCPRTVQTSSSFFSDSIHFGNDPMHPRTVFGSSRFFSHIHYGNRTMHPRTMPGHSLSSTHILQVHPCALEQPCAPASSLHCVSTRSLHPRTVTGSSSLFRRVQ